MKLANADKPSLKLQCDDTSFRNFLAGSKLSFTKAFWPNSPVDLKSFGGGGMKSKLASRDCITKIAD